VLAATRRQFLDEYSAVRAFEGRGADDAAWYFELPYRDLSGGLSEQWRIRAQSWRCLERRVLPDFARKIGPALRILDLGAGNCWMSWRLANLGHSPVAVDIFTDPRDGLRASRHYTEQTAFPVIEAEFDNIPLPAGSADLAIFNASFHYSADYERTMGEIKRVLQPAGAVVIMDTPVYRLPRHGRMMVEERKRLYKERFGFPSDAQRSVEYLDENMLDHLARRFDLHWTIYRPWYGWRWHARPLKAWLQRKRPPSRFRVLVGEANSA
jgi:ubiquinone/menaquinone biosynthesis C-methylase UbiE